MTTDQYVDDILLQLGSPILDIEIRDSLPKVVDLAFRQVKKSITDTKTITIPYSNRMDLSEYNVNSVTYVVRGDNRNNLINMDTIIYYHTLFSTDALSTGDYRRQMMIDQTKNTLSTDLQFHFEKPYLYVNANHPKPATITVFYIPDYQDVSEVTEPHWETIIGRYSLALAKGMLGRVRGKYKLDSALYQLDSDQLLSESNSELQELRTYLDENSDIVMPID